jgi:hypothetical protein
MRNSYEELTRAKNQISKLDARYVEELKAEASLFAANRKRGTEDGKAWEELLKVMNVDVSSLLKQDKADSKKAEQTLKVLQSQLITIPADVLQRVHDQILVDQLADAKVDWDQPVSHWLSYSLPYYRSSTVDYYQSGDSNGTVEGDWGIVSPLDPFSSTMNPKSNAVGAGTGWGDENDVHARCWLYYYISGDKIARPGTVYVWPYFDIHGSYYVRANDGYFTSKEAQVQVKITTRIFRPDYTYAEYFTWTVLDKGSDNIDEAARVDFTGWNNSAKAQSQVNTGESLTVQVIAELVNHANGSGSHALLDFQTGEGNQIRIPNIAVWVP